MFQVCLIIAGVRAFLSKQNHGCNILIVSLIRITLPVNITGYNLVAAN